MYIPDADLTKQLLVVGAFVGCGYALLAIGMVLIYRINGVINFAHGAIGTVAAYLAFEVSQERTVWFGLLVAVGFGVACGIALERLAMQRVRGKLEGTILTLGVMIAFQAVVLLKWGSAPRRLPSLVGHGNVTFWGITTSWDTILLAAVTLAVSLALFAFLRWTAVGLQMEAASQDELGARLNGISPGLMSLLSWVIASGLAGLAGVLLARQLQLLPGTLSTLTILALVPAFIGGLRSFVLTLAGGIIYGAVTSYLSGYVNDNIDVLRDSLPFIVVLLVLIVGTRAFGGRLTQEREV